MYLKAIGRTFCGLPPDGSEFAVTMGTSNMKPSESNAGVSRRRFLAAAGAAVALPAFVPGRVLGLGGQASPSKRINIGVVGCGGQGNGNTDGFLRNTDCRVVAACDVDATHLANMLQKVNGQYNSKDCRGYRDFRELMARKDIDAVMLAVPDHWHALIAVEAAKEKKDIYGEKPLARTIVEQQAIVRAVKKNRCIWQTGSWQRSGANFHKAAEIVRNGLIGKITRVEVGLPSGPKNPKEQRKVDSTPPPAELDYDLWIGPSTMIPYVGSRIHNNWRWNYNTGGGQLLDWIGHHCDIAHWGMDCDNSGPLEVSGEGEFPPADYNWNVCTRYRIEAKYPNAITMTLAGGHHDIRAGTKWIGTDGWVWVDRGGFESSNPDWRDFKDLPEEMRKVKLYRSRDHIRNFLDCIKSRQPTITPAETAHHSSIPGHLGLIAMVTGRTLRWDAEKEVILDDAAASQMLGRPYRGPWKLG